MFGDLGNMQGLMKQAKQLKEQMEAEQQKIGEQLFTGSVAEGRVKVVFTGNRVMRDLVIAPEVVDQEDVEMLQDLIVAATNQALEKIEHETAKTLGKYTQGIPGF